ncbi:uncharacterized protein PV07_10509 [Cladophialophora immunda]|uniref:Protein kinase domain-containing protein n=1 Tax=Cladophialophora immunda TaxID=569365 RepID=A0A0D2CMM4_9EURO|nr:uncharacterized protein PV07_10509 [Cladophialophora immunda]KIW24819.1 hypothetical protein PV07_10509 [Cladophialophora immunda]
MDPQGRHVRGLSLKKHESLQGVERERGITTVGPSSPAAPAQDRWILNLFQRFDEGVEKLFLTYVDDSNHWRRMTISYKCRDAEPMSLELDLSSLASPEDKMSRIWESIYEHLHEIRFFDTVTRLELRTIDSTLNVFVRESIDEVIQYPPRDIVRLFFDSGQFAPFEICEDELVLDSHLYGFVYRIQHGDRYYVKKDIPGSDAIDRFVYEIRALYALRDCGHVVKLEGIVLDDTLQLVKGILVGYLENGAVVDLLGGGVPWRDRCRWAEQAIRGLCDVHAEGYVQGDFTLSNLAIDEQRDAKIIDFNRRGCPIGWEPPELADHPASLYIGEKSDLFQLGMILWALAMNDDQPERHRRPLSLKFPQEIPGWYRNIVATCLSPRPRNRLCAERLIRMLPQTSPSFSKCGLEDFGQSPTIGSFDVETDISPGPIYAATEVPTRPVSFSKVKTQLLEKSTLSKILGHKQPHIIGLQDLFEIDNSIWLSMEDHQGCNLFELIQKNLALEESIIARICRDVLLALTFLQLQGVVHGNIRSDNILMSTTGYARLSSFDFCFEIENSPKIRDIKGTSRWVAPEMLKEEPYNHKVDIWSLGITIIEMIQGIPPYSGLPPSEAMAMVAKNGPPRITGRDEGEISEPMSLLLHSSLQVIPSSRPSADVLLLYPLILDSAPRSAIISLVEKHEAGI